MTMNATSTLTDQPQLRRVRWALGALAALSLAGLATLQTLGGGDTPLKAPTHTVSAPARDHAPRAAALPSAVSYIIVGSAEEAARERARVTEINHWAGPLAATIVVAETDAAAEDIRRAASNLTALRDAEGLPPIRVTDLRPGRATALSPLDSSRCGLDVRAGAC